MKPGFCKLKLRAGVGEGKESAHMARLSNLIRQPSSEVIEK
jgi:hypothetical protein